MCVHLYPQWNNGVGAHKKMYKKEKNLFILCQCVFPFPLFFTSHVGAGKTGMQSRMCEIGKSPNRTYLNHTIFTPFPIMAVGRSAQTSFI